MLLVALITPGGSGAQPVAGSSMGSSAGSPEAVASRVEAERPGASNDDQPAAPPAANDEKNEKDAKDAKNEKGGPRVVEATIPRHGPGTFTRARVDGPKVGAKGGRLLRYAVLVELGLPYEADQTAREIQQTLSDRRSWTGGGKWRLQLVGDRDRADFTILLATPDTVDRYCWPLRTYGRVSCRAGDRVMLNARRWARGAPAYGSDVAAYRHYLVNHEVGHRLGNSHVGCPGRGRLAPVMMQQTKGVGSCEANPWPAPKRHG